MVTLTWHACKYKVHKLHQRYILKLCCDGVADQVVQLHVHTLPHLDPSPVILTEHIVLLPTNYFMKTLAEQCSWDEILSFCPHIM